MRADLRASLPWKLFGALSAVFLLLYFFVLSETASTWQYPYLSLAAAVAVFLGIALHRPAASLGWAAFGLGLFFIFSGDIQITYEYMVNETDDFPTIGDLAFLTGFLFLIVGAVFLLRESTRAHDRGVVIDALIVALGVGILAWSLFMAPYLTDDSMSMRDRLIAMAYPLADVVLLLVIARLSFDGRSITPSTVLLTAGALIYLLADAWAFYLDIEGGYYHRHPVDAGWLIGYVCFGLAAMHPSVAQRRPARVFSRPGLTQRRLILLAVCTLLAPAALITQWWWDDTETIPVVAGGSALLFVLVLLRLSLYVAEHRRSEARERTLRRMGTELGGAKSIEEALATAEAGATEFARGTRARVQLLTGDVQALRPVRGGATHGWPLNLAELAPDVADQLVHGEPVDLADGEHTALGTVLGRKGGGNGIAAPVVVRDELVAVVLALGDPLPQHLANSLRALAAQVGLTIENILLNEDLLRRRSEARFKALIQHAADVIAIVQTDGAVRFVSPAVSHLTGLDVDAVTGVDIGTLIHPDDQQLLADVLAGTARPRSGRGVVLLRVRAAGETWRLCETRVSDLTNDQDIGGIVLTLRDVTEQKNLERELFHQAFHDPLTDLPNRSLFMDRLLHGIDRANRTAEPLAVVFIDVDDFKIVNDSLGHAVGDVLLQSLAQRFTSVTRPGDTVSRFAGDEFTVLLEHADLADASSFAERLQEVMRQPIRVAGRDLTVTISVGFAVKSDPELTADDLLRQADVAMYVAKTRGKSSWAAFDPGMGDAIWQRLEIEGDLRRAVERDEFVVHYQPIIELETERITELEALIRWNHPTRGLVGPTEFLPIAEKTRLILQIGWWAIETACRQAAEWRSEHPAASNFVIAVNVSAAMLRQHDAVDRVAAILSATGIEPGSLKLEITESAMVFADGGPVETLQQLKDLGVLLAIDDFGTGHSSLSYLRDFPIDVVKIDRSFVTGMDESDSGVAIVETIVDLARALGINVTSEGIESEGQLERVRSLGSDHAQGYLFSKPLPADEVETLLATWPVTTDIVR